MLVSLGIRDIEFQLCTKLFSYDCMYKKMPNIESCRNLINECPFSILS